MKYAFKIALILILTFSLTNTASSQNLKKMKQEVEKSIESKAQLTQQMVDMIYSFSELGFQEFETSKYVTGILEENGFTVERGQSGIPTAWFAKWGSGSPVIALGSDIDGLPDTSQKPGVAYRDPLVKGAPGHGEGHNSGQALNVTAAIAVKEMMEKENMQGTIVLWPGVAEEIVAAKAFFARDGYFKGVDAVLFTHVSSGMGVTWGDASGSGLVSVEYTFFGQTAHGAGAPWSGRSALDAVELMNAGWNYRREHLRLQQRSHYVITDGGDQPNVVPGKATVWYYFREIEYPRIKELHEIGNTIAEAAAMMTNTEMESRVVGAAWPRHFNKVIAETMQKNIDRIGMPTWTENDQILAKAAQAEMKSNRTTGLSTTVRQLRGPARNNMGGGSDDIGDVSWLLPTVTLRFPSNIPGLPSHHWSSGIAMATPIAHKGATAGAKVIATTMLDLFKEKKILDESWKYFNDVQTQEQTYEPLISSTDKPAIEKNVDIMAKYRPEMKKLYFNPKKYKTYLEQLGITYPTLKKK